MEQIIDEEWNVNARNVSSDTHGDKFATTAHYDKLVREFHPITHLTKDDDYRTTRLILFLSCLYLSQVIY